ncbi:MAG: hypothetical protein IKL42_00315 [Clostridia bacterium]|nr:hypothetical protein [Clostridia bacterium]MBR3575829.1 hypothetical protein [Clostridia bacterium]
MKRVFSIALILFVLFMCSACNSKEPTKQICKHEWQDATCETPVTCKVCSETAGNAIGHQWQDATCTTAKKCIVCSKTEGESLGHNWQDATYTKPKTCTTCGTTTGNVLSKPSNNSPTTNTPTVSRCRICSNVTSRKETPYCSTHDCTISTCPYPAKNDNRGGWGSHCEFHGCPTPGCLGWPQGSDNSCASCR